MTGRCITIHLAQKPDYVTWHFEERVISAMLDLGPSLQFSPCCSLATPRYMYLYLGIWVFVIVNKRRLV